MLVASRVAMAMLKYVKIQPCKSVNPSTLSDKDIEAAQKSIAKAVSVVTEKSRVVDNTIHT